MNSLVSLVRDSIGSLMRPLGGDRKKKAALEAAIAGPSAAKTPAVPAPPAIFSAEDYEAFLKIMHEGGKRPFRKPGITVKQEFELWAAAQAKERAAAAAKAAAAAAMAPAGNGVRA